MTAKRYIIEPSWDMYADLDTNGTQLDPWHAETARERVGMILAHNEGRKLDAMLSRQRAARQKRIRARRVQRIMTGIVWGAMVVISLSMWWAIIWLAWAVYTAVQ